MVLHLPFIKKSIFSCFRVGYPYTFVQVTEEPVKIYGCYWHVLYCSYAYIHVYTIWVFKHFSHAVNFEKEIYFVAQKLTAFLDERL